MSDQAFSDSPRSERSTSQPVDVIAGTALSVVAGGITGAIAGFVWGGIGGRIAMRVLFLTSSDLVKGATSDDGFEIGRISTDTIFLLIAMTVLGGFVGAAYGLVRMLLRGPLWLTALGVALTLGAGAGGGLIVSAEGVDFRFLTPLWLAVGLFIFLPAAWGLTVAVATDRLLHHQGISKEPLPGVDARPLGPIGDALGWAGITTATVLGILDLLRDLEQLT